MLRATNDGEAWDAFAELIGTVKRCEKEGRTNGKITHVLELIRIDESEGGWVEVKLIGTNPDIPELLANNRRARLADIQKEETAARKMLRKLRGLKEKFPWLKRFFGDAGLLWFIKLFEPLAQAP
jgi:hypothetical protein